MGRAFGAFLVSLLLLPFAAPPSSAEPALSLRALVGPPVLAVGENLSIDVFVYFGADLVDPTTIIAKSGYAVIPVTKQELGHYAAQWPIEYGGQFSHRLSLFFDAKLGDDEASTTVYYAVRDNATQWESPAGWNTEFALNGPRGPSTNFLEGETVVIVSRTTFMGVPTDGPPIHPSIDWAEGSQLEDADADFGFDPPRSAHLGPGLYEFSYEIPAHLTLSRGYRFSTDANGAKLRWAAHPFPVSMLIDDADPGNVVLTVLAGGADPFAGAAVAFTARTTAYEPYERHVLTLNTTLGRFGNATFRAPVPSYGEARVLANITWGGETAFLAAQWGAYPPAEAEPLSSTFSARLRSATWGALPGEQADIEVQLGGIDGPLRDAPVTLLMTREYYPDLERAVPGPMALNLTTSSEGYVAIRYDVPADWAPAERLVLHFVRDQNFSTTLKVDLGPESYDEWGQHVVASVAGSYADPPLRIGASLDYPAGGVGTVEILNATALLTPRIDPPVHVGLAAGPLGTGILVPGTADWSGTIALPRWLETGTYQVTVMLTLGVTSEGQYYEVFAMKSLNISLLNQYQPPEPPAAAGPPPTWIWALVVGVTAAALVVVVGRLRKRPR